MIYASIIIVVVLFSTIAKRNKFKEKALVEKDEELKDAFEKVIARYNRNINFQIITPIVVLLLFLIFYKSC